MTLDEAYKHIQKRGIDPRLVNLRPVARNEEGIVGYMRPIESPQNICWKFMQIIWAWRYKDALIGFVFPDGSLRHDTEMLMSPLSGPMFPTAVAFYKPEVPMNQRTHLATFENRSTQKPTVTVA